MAIAFTDQQVRQNVLDDISHDVRIDSNNVDVTVTDGTVFLGGSVPTFSQKITAAQDARQIKGVIDVVNNLTVSLAQVWNDVDIRETIRRNLDRDVRLAQTGNVGVIVANGVVTLTGTAPSYGQKTSAADDAWTAPGVIDVINDIAVVPTTPRTDAAIAADVRRALDTDPNLNAARITTSVVNAVVQLDGSMPTYYQIGAAGNDAWGVPGVVDVVNNLTVS
ncbi:MAG: BON domain-containing protein [Chloroflexota bacterium]